MYFVISKTETSNGQRTILKGDIASREDARTFARENDGSVKTSVELTQMIGDGKIVISQPITQETPTVSQNQFPTPPAPVINTRSPAADPTDPAQTNVTAPEQKTLSISDAAEQVASESTKRTTVGKKEKAPPKRVKTADEVLARARTYVSEELAPALTTDRISKVEFVRSLSLWEDKALQRSDALALTAAADVGISPATVSTQFQFARSDRMNAHADRAKEREAEAAKRDEKKKAAEAERAQKKLDREAEAKRKADDKASKKAAKEAAKAKDTPPATDTPPAE